MVPGHTGDGVGHQEAGGSVAEEQMVLKPSTSTPSPGISPQIPAGLPGTCGRTLPAAPSPARVLSGALQGGREPSVTGVGTLGQRVPPEPPSAVEQGGSIPTTPHEARGALALVGGAGRGAVGSPAVPARTLQGFCVLSPQGIQLLLQVFSLFHLGSGEMTNPALRDALALPTPSDSLPDGSRLPKPFLTHSFS